MAARRERRFGIDAWGVRRNETVQWTVSAANGRSPGQDADHIPDEADFSAHVRYCWINPVKHGFVGRAVDWPYSSIHRDMARGIAEPEWSGVVTDGAFGGSVGETHRFREVGKGGMVGWHPPYGCYQ